MTPSHRETAPAQRRAAFLSGGPLMSMWFFGMFTVAIVLMCILFPTPREPVCTEAAGYRQFLLECCSHTDAGVAGCRRRAQLLGLEVCK